MVGRHATPRPGWRGWGVGLCVVALAVAGVGIYLTSSSPALTAGSVPTSTTSTTPASSTTSTIAATTTTVAATHVTLAAVGDTELGNTPQLPADPVAYFSPVESALAGDVVFGNLEGTMSSAGPSKCATSSTGCYAFRVPPSFAEVYRRVGFTVLNSANNHSYDYGVPGEVQTSAALAAAGIVQAGLPGQIGLVHVHGVAIAFVDFAPYYLTNNLLVADQESALIAQARREASIVVVYMHAGAEGASAEHVTRQSEYYYGENRGNPYAFAHAAIDEGADLVVGSGPHVLRGMQWYRGKLIAYSLGDFTNYEAFSSAGALALSAVLHVTWDVRGVITAASISPVVIRPGGQAVPDPTHAAWAFMNQLSREDFAASAAIIGARGDLAIPPGA